MKKSEIKELDLAGLQDQLAAFAKEYSDLKMAHAITPLENPMQLRTLRRSVARIASELTKRDNQ